MFLYLKKTHTTSGRKWRSKSKLVVLRESHIFCLQDLVLGIADWSCIYSGLKRFCSSRLNSKKEPVIKKVSRFTKNNIFSVSIDIHRLFNSSAHPFSLSSQLGVLPSSSCFFFLSFWFLKLDDIKLLSSTSCFLKSRFRILLGCSSGYVIELICGPSSIYIGLILQIIALCENPLTNYCDFICFLTWSWFDHNLDILSPVRDFFGFTSLCQARFILAFYGFSVDFADVGGTT